MTRHDPMWTRCAVCGADACRCHAAAEAVGFVMTPDMWAATTLLTCAPWIEADLHKALTPEAAGTIAQHWLHDGSYADAHSYVKANAGGVRYSHPDGTVGRLSWTQTAELIRGTRVPDPQQGLFS